MIWSDMTSLSCFDAMRHVVIADATCEYTTLSQYYPGMNLVEGTVYFATAEDFLAADANARHVAFILLTSGPSQPLDIQSACNIGRFDSKPDFDQCFDGLEEEFKTVRSIDQGVRQLMRLTSSSSSIQDEVAFISKVYGVPVSLADESFNFIAVAGHFADLSDKLITEFDEGRVAPDIQETLRRTGVMRPVGSLTRTAPFATGQRSKTGQMIYNNAAPIYIGNMLVGNLSFFTVGGPLPRTRTPFLPTIAATLSMEFQKNDYWLENKGSFYTHLLSGFVHGDRGSQLGPEDVRMRFKVAGYDLKHYKYIIHYRMNEESFTLREVQVIASRIQKGLPNAIFFIDEGNIVFLSSSDEFLSTTSLEQRINGMIKDSVLSHTSVRVGISSAFTNMARAKECYEQTIAAVRVGRTLHREKNVFPYNRYRLDNMLAHLAPDVDYTMYLYPPLVALIEEDQRKGTHLAYTLYAYLKDPEHPLDVCKELNIHKNTLYFRLNKAKEFMHYDFKYGDVALQIMLSFKLLEHFGRFKNLVLETDRHRTLDS